MYCFEKAKKQIESTERWKVTLELRETQVCLKLPSLLQIYIKKLFWSFDLS